MQKNRQYKTGYTTGVCAQAAAYAAGLMLVTGRRVDKVRIQTPSKVKLVLNVCEQKISFGSAKCAVIKDSGDDAPQDVTHGMKIFAEVRPSGRSGVRIRGGKGIGRLTKPGLALAVGERAINPVPRRMIEQELAELLRRYPYAYKGLEATIRAPQGQALAKHTFNPQLGIVGGISILGTTGIVEPKSAAAYQKSLSLRLDVLKAQGHKKVILVLGYVSEKFAKDTLGASQDYVIKIGDHVGFMLKECAKKNMEKVLLIGHIGKMIKVAGGQFNTHCNFGDGRLERIAQDAKRCGAGQEVIEQIERQRTAEAAVKILRKARLEKVFKKIARDCVKKMKMLVGAKLKIQCAILSLKGEALSAL